MAFIKLKPGENRRTYMMNTAISVNNVLTENVIIECRNLMKVFQRNSLFVKALDGIDLTICKGEFFSVVGKNGSGKSTLLNIIGALARPTSGDIFVNRMDIGKMPEHQLAHFRAQQIGFIFQDCRLLAGYTVFENIELAMVPGNCPAHLRAERIMALLEKIKIDHRAHHYPAELSAGERQRAAVARAFVDDPAIILADEPTADVDPESAEIITQLIMEKNANEQITIVLATHGTFQYQLSTRNCFVRNGTVVSQAESGY
jgi:putative ABC transport system ATP-binding protein